MRTSRVKAPEVESPGIEGVGMAIPVPADLLDQLTAAWQAGALSARNVGSLEEEEAPGLEAVRSALAESQIVPGRLWLTAAELRPMLSDEAQLLPPQLMGRCLALCLPIRRQGGGTAARYGVDAQTYKRALALARERRQAGE